MNAEQRIKELTTRQIFYESSTLVKLNAINGRFFYKVYAWIDQGKQDSKILIKEGKYEGQDPIDLIQSALIEMEIKKIKLGKVVNTSQMRSTS